MFNKTKLSETDFLLPNNDFIIGMGSLLNIAGSYFNYNTSESENEADAKALYSDWATVGKDIKNAKKNFRKKEIELCH